LFGTTTSCAFDDVTSIGSVCKKYGVYLLIDASYAGSALVCPEYQKYMQGIEVHINLLKLSVKIVYTLQYADSFNVNAHKLLLTNHDCSPIW